MTYADKYALMKAYKISTGDDPDQQEPKPEKIDDEQHQAQKKAEQVAATLIDDKKFETLQGELDRTGYKASAICKGYKVNSLKELNIQQWADAMSKLAKVKTKPKTDLGLEQEDGMEVKILKEQLPVIQINFEEMKNALSETLAYYEGIVVAEDNLGECKEAQKELAGVRVKIDNYRKDKKKELSKPIIEFENQCKELIELVEIVEKPIKDGIKIFDNKRREEKKLIAERIIKEISAEYELNEKYAARLTIDERYCNLSIKEIEVKNDVEAKAMALKVEQNSEEGLS